MILDFYVKTGIRFSLRDKRLFEITEVEITRVDCIMLKLALRMSTMHITLINVVTVVCACSVDIDYYNFASSTLHFDK